MDREWIERICRQVAEVWIFGISGALIMFVGYWIFDKLTPRIDVAKELVENKNTAVAIMVGFVILGMAIIVAATMLPWSPPGQATPAPSISPPH